MYQYESKTELRKATIGREIREVVFTGALGDTRATELRFTDGTTLQISATSFGTLRFEA